MKLLLVLEIGVVFAAAALFALSFTSAAPQAVKFSWRDLFRHGMTVDRSSPTQLRIEAAFVLAVGVLVWWFCSDR